MAGRLGGGREGERIREGRNGISVGRYKEDVGQSTGGEAGGWMDGRMGGYRDTGMGKEGESV